MNKLRIPNDRGWHWGVVWAIGPDAEDQDNQPIKSGHRTNNLLFQLAKSWRYVFWKGNGLLVKNLRIPSEAHHKEEEQGWNAHSVSLSLFFSLFFGFCILVSFTSRHLFQPVKPRRTIIKPMGIKDLILWIFNETAYLPTSIPSDGCCLIKRSCVYTN